MIVKFNIKTFKTEHDAYKAFENALVLLGKYDISVKTNIYESELYVTTEFTGKMAYSRTYVINFDSDEDYNTYLLIKD